MAWQPHVVRGSSYGEVVQHSAIRLPVPLGPPPALHAVQVVAVALRPVGAELHVLASAQSAGDSAAASMLPRTWLVRPATPESAAIRAVGRAPGIAGYQVGVTVEGHPGARPGAGLVSCGVLLLSDPNQTLRGTWVPVSETNLTAGDAAFLEQAREFAVRLLENADTALRLVTQPFVLAELRAVYEAFLGYALDVSAFNKRVTKAPDYLRPGPIERRRRGRPARTYTRGQGAAAWAGQLPRRLSATGKRQVRSAG